MTTSPDLGLWPIRATQPPPSRSDATWAHHVFPSGRQAITAALQGLGLHRTSLVAIPDWSSHCLWSAVARVASPLPLSAVQAGGLAVDGVLAYEQWGWSPSPTVLARLRDLARGGPLILDSVDTAHLPDQPGTAAPAEARVWSLSKLLGLPGGGLLAWPDGFQPYADPIAHRPLATALETLDPSLAAPIAKDGCRHRPAALMAHLRNVDLAAWVAQEGAHRLALLTQAIAHPACGGLPAWLRVAVETGTARAGLLPVFGPAARDAVAGTVTESTGLAAEVRRFNTHDDDAPATFRPALALPVHGGIDPDRLTAALDIAGQAR